MGLTTKMKAKVIIILLLVLVVFACQSRRLVKQPKLGKVTEFHREQNKVMPYLFATYNTRGQDHNRASLQNSVGGGLGLFIRSKMSDQWLGHKSFYYYIDFEASPEHWGQPSSGNRQWVFSTYPGFYMRTYLPLKLKMFMGVGINLRMGAINHNNLRMGAIHYDRWGPYIHWGAELFGISASTIFIVHPGQANIEMEYRAGYMFYPLDF